MKKVKVIQPKFKIGDKVIMSRKTLYGEKEGVITQGPVRMFRDIDGTHCHSEEHIKKIQLPYEFDGETLTIHYPQYDMGNFIEKAHSTVAKFYCYSYIVESEKMNTEYFEKMLKLK